MSKPLPQAQRLEIVQLYESGSLTSELAQKYNVNPSTIISILRANGVENRGQSKVTASIISEIERLYESGLTYRQIAEQVGISPATTLRFLKKSGITLRKARISKETKHAIVSAYNSGESTRAIASKLDMSDSTIYAILVSCCAEIRTPKSTKGYEREISDLYQSGLSLEAVALKFRVTGGAIRSVLERKGIARRSQKETTANNWKNPEYANAVNSKRSNQTGEKSHLWKGGKTSLRMIIRTSKTYADWRISVFRRDNFTCCHCGKPSSELPKSSLQADHKYPFSKILDDYSIKTREQAMECTALWDIDNGQTLCADCHKKTPTYGIKALSYDSGAVE